MELAIFLSWYIIGFISCVALWKIDESDKLMFNDLIAFFVFAIFGVGMTICLWYQIRSGVVWQSKKCKKSVDETTKV
jgi:hypothetical protein